MRKKALGEAGFIAGIASNGREGLELAKNVDWQLHLGLVEIAGKRGDETRVTLRMPARGQIGSVS